MLKSMGVRDLPSNLGELTISVYLLLKCVHTRTTDKLHLKMIPVNYSGIIFEKLENIFNEVALQVDQFGIQLNFSSISKKKKKNTF